MEEFQKNLKRQRQIELYSTAELLSSIQVFFIVFPYFPQKIYNTCYLEVNLLVNLWIHQSHQSHHLEEYFSYIYCSYTIQRSSWGKNIQSLLETEKVTPTISLFLLVRVLSGLLMCCVIVFSLFSHHRLFLIYWGCVMFCPSPRVASVLAVNQVIFFVQLLLANWIHPDSNLALVCRRLACVWPHLVICHRVVSGDKC